MRVSHLLVVRPTVFLFVVLFGLISGSLFAKDDITAAQIIKPKNDKRHYQYFELDNKLRVLLVEDTSVEKTAVSLDVNVGSGRDPDDRAGLAHFLEHMLFLGTAKYPKAGEFQDFISGHGGRHNAFTSVKHTNYFFDINVDVLDEGIDRFAQFFISPLFDKQYVDRERNAVHSEFRSKYSSEGRRQMDALREIVVKQNPFSKFPTGNLESLQVDTPRSLYVDLKNFYQEHYSAQRMTLVIISQKNIDELRQLVVDAFSGIKSTPITKQKKVPDLIAQEALPAELAIVPLAETRSVSFMFPVPDTHTLYKQKPLSYIGYFVGYEGRGSLLSALKKDNWATGLSTGVGYDWHGGDAFHVNVQLTKQGINKLDEIEALLFEYLSLMKKRGVSKKRFEEMQYTGLMAFEYGDKIDPYREAMYFSHQLHTIPLQDLLSSPYLFSDYDEELINRYLSYISPSNLFRKIVSPEIKPDKVSKIYDTPYRYNKNVSVQAKCMTSHCLTLKGLLSLPEKNTYIPKSFNLVSNNRREKPEIIKSGVNFSVWYAPDNVFKLPMGYVKARYKFPEVGLSVDAYVTAKLMVSILREHMNEKSYDASMGGLSYSLNTNTRGIDLAFSGYSDSLEYLVRDVTKTIKRFRKKKAFRQELNQKYFDQVKKELIRRQDNKSLQTPYQQLFAEVPAFLYSPYWSRTQILDALGRMTLDSYSQQVNQFFSKAVTQVFVYGNYSKSHALKLQKPLVSLIRSNGGFMNRYPEEVTLLPGKTTKLRPSSKIQVVPKAVEHKDKALISYFQASDDSLESQAKFRLLVQCIDSYFYHQLRTEQQLGYIVSTSFYPIRKVPALVNIIQSPNVDSAELLKRVDVFYTTAQSEVFNHFARDKAAIIGLLREKSQNQTEQAGQWWSSILTNDVLFDKHERLAKLITDLSLEEMQELYRNVFIDSPRRLYFVTESEKFQEKEYNTINNSQKFKIDHSSYVYP